MPNSSLCVTARVERRGKIFLVAYIDEGDSRFISKDVEPEELVWHRDSEERWVTVESGQGWQLQYNGWLPILLSEGNKYHIQKKLFHRLIRGATDLKLKIERE